MSPRRYVLPLDPFVINSAENIAAATAWIAGGVGHWTVSVAAGTRFQKPVLLANMVLSGAATAFVTWYLLNHTHFHLSIAGVVIGAFGIGAVWGPSGLWKVAAWAIAQAARAGQAISQGLPAPPLPPTQLPPASPPQQEDHDEPTR